LFDVLLLRPERRREIDVFLLGVVVGNARYPDVVSEVRRQFVEV